MRTTDARDQTRAVDVVRVSAMRTRAAADVVVREEPLSITINGDSFVVTMRTPGHDRELALGLLWSEGIIAGRSEVLKASHCGRTDDAARPNTFAFVLAEDALRRLDRLDGASRRGTLVNAACGVCGRERVDDLATRLPVVPVRATCHAARVTDAVLAMASRQPLFAQTGGCHGALLARFDGSIVGAFEDVGRHNAVDKIVGAEFARGALPLSEHILVVSGRASFELVQKAAAAGIPILASVSAPSSLAIELAERLGVTLVGFVRGDAAVIYSGKARLTMEPPAPLD